jgi:hypothetical protein
MIGHPSGHRAEATLRNPRPFWDRRERVTIVRWGAQPLLFSAF